MTGRGGKGLAIALLATGMVFAFLLAGHSQRAGATFPGKNGLISFSRTTEDPDGNGFCTSIWSVAASGNGSKRLSGGCSFDDAPSWSADGKRIVFTQDERVYTMSKRGDDFERVTKGKKFEGKKFYDNNPSWSPDGRRIMFWRGASGWSRIFSVRPDGSDLTEIIGKASGLYGIDPVYSPNGEFIAFAGGDADGKEAIYLIRPDGSDLRAVTVPGKDVQDPDWSPDGERIVFSGQAGGFELFSVRPGGTDLDKLTNNSGDPFGPVYSPDGSRIAFSNSSELSTIPAGGGKPKVVVKRKKKVFDDAPSWQAK